MKIILPKPTEKETKSANTLCDPGRDRLLD